MSTPRRNFFGTGSVIVPSDGEGAVRRSAITADKLVTQPFEGIDVIPDLVGYAARTHGHLEAVGWRNIINIYEEEIEVKRTVGGKEVTETMRNRYFELSNFEYISFLEVRERVLELARGLLHYGILKTDVFNIYAQTSVNWQLMSHACATISTPVATAYDTLGEAGLMHALNEPDCVGIFTNAELLPTLSRVIRETSSVRVVIYDGDAKSTLLNRIRAVREDIAVVSIDELRVTGREQPLDILEPRKPSPDDVALIMYTSGSTGAPKGVVLTHANVVASIGGVFHMLGHHLRVDDAFLAYLPLAHILEYVVELALFTVGMKTGYGRVKTLTDASVRNCKGDILAFQPTILVGVPQVWEMIRKDILAEVNARRSLWKSISSSVRAATGGRLRLALSGGAALSKETQEFFSVAPVTMLQGYGITESCAMCAILPPELMQYGVVGLPSPCIEIKLIDVPEAGYKATGNPCQGEVCIRGPSMIKGYYKRPDLNEDETIFTKDGWFRTGDVGQWNPDGTLSLIDRIENLVKLQGGEYIALERLEATYRSCNLVSNICVHASAEAKQPIAIIIPHEPNLRYVLAKQSLPDVDATASLLDLCHNEAVQELVLKECNLVGKKNDFKGMEMLEAVILTAEEWTPESGLVTAVQTVQRRKIAKHFQHLMGRFHPLQDKNEELSRTNSAFDRLKSQHATVQRNNSNLQSALDAQKGVVVKANQTISNLKSALKTAQEDAKRERVEAKTLKADYAAKVTRFQRDNSDLQSSLDAQKGAVAKANQTISNLESALKTAQLDAKRGRVEAETLTADYVTRFQRDNSDLQSALDALKREVAEDKLRLSLGIADFKQWMRESSIDADTLISADPSTSSSDMHHVLAHNALMKVHSENWSSAYEDAKKSIVTRPSTMGYITKALAQIGMGESEEAMQVFDLAFRNCNPNESELLLLIKTILLFMSRKCDTAISRIHDLIAVSRDDERMYCYIQVLGKMHLMQGDYARAVQSLERGHDLASSSASSDMETISLIFGWTFDGLQITVQRYLCEDLYALGRVEEATEGLLKLLNTFGEEMRARKGPTDWVVDLKKKCIESLVTLGDAALNFGEHGDAIAQYTSALSLDPANPLDILVKRSKARASKEMWEDAQTDADEVIKRDPSSYLGYERKYVALHGAEDYGEANNALLHMLSIIESSPDAEIWRLRANYTTPRETIAAIDIAIPEIFSLCPLVLIDLTTGRLCNAQERIQIFKSETPFKKLVSETATRKIDCVHIRQSVAKYFKWIMFSHTWEGREPTLKDVNLVNSVWELDDSPLNEKLRQFCTTASEDGYRWAWSDTCCIDKDTSAILSQSLIAMYNWYEKAEETLVYLADVLSSAELGDLALTNSRWMTRAWTLQELLASKVIRFYNREWKLYLNDTHANHKESPAIKQELAQAMGVPPETITSFHPDDLGVREKLRLASTRKATVEEDIAYSLIGIFSSNIVPRYGLGKTALGELLENIVARTGDVTVIAWTGKSLPYNSALPASLAVYSQVPYSPPPMEDSELDTCVEQLRTQLASQDALAFHYRVAELPRATFGNGCLQLPCIAFCVTKISVQEPGGNQGTLYRATVSSLGKVEFRTADVMPLKKPRKLVFVHPWLRDLHHTLDGFVSEDERETESDAGSGDGTDDASAPASPLPAEPSAPVDRFTQALRLISRLGREFNALLFEQQPNRQYKRVAAEEEIIVRGVPHKTNPKDIKVKVLEII